MTSAAVHRRVHELQPAPTSSVLTCATAGWLSCVVCVLFKVSLTRRAIRRHCDCNIPKVRHYLDATDSSLSACTYGVRWHGWLCAHTIDVHVSPVCLSPEPARLSLSFFGVCVCLPASVSAQLSLRAYSPLTRGNMAHTRTRRHTFVQAGWCRQGGACEGSDGIIAVGRAGVFPGR